MSVAELVGHIEDLNADYDVIYIGMNTQLLNCVDADKDDNDKGVKKGDHIPNYNDTSMKGMIYTSIGDIKIAQESLLRIRQILMNMLNVIQGMICPMSMPRS